MAFLELAWGTFSSWLWLFGAPLKDFNVLWIIIPIWISWFFTEFFQEKHGTAFGNAITNGAIPIWVAIDWCRNLTFGLTQKTIETNYTLYVKFGLAAFILIYGFFVIIQGLKEKEFAHYGGRIRVITYFLVMFTPIVYGTAEISLRIIIAIFVFFPLYYLLIELIVRIVPDSKALKDDEHEKPEDATLPNSPSSPAPKQQFSSQQEQNSYALPGVPTQPQQSVPNGYPSEPNFNQLPNAQSRRF